MPIELDTSINDGAKIMVIGVGGGGGNAINNMVEGGLNGVEFIAANTDAQALEYNLAKTKIRLGEESHRGLGAGGRPEVGAMSVKESEEKVRHILKNSDMVFVTAGMGGGTGTGGAPEVARIASELDALVVGIVTKPFIWEGKKRNKAAEEGINNLREHVDALIVIQNQRLLEIIDKNTALPDAFKKVDEVLFNATRGISDIISRHGKINVDFADVRTIMKGMGDAIMGIGIAKGENRAKEATMNALNSPLLDGISIAGAKGVLVNVSGGVNMSMFEVAEAVSIIEHEAGDDANIIHGIVINEGESDEIMITVVATGFNAKSDSKKYVAASNNNNFNGNFNNKVAPSLPFNDHDTAARIKKASTNFKTGFNNPYPNISDLTISPRGLNQLKKYDSPAFERRGTSVPPLGSDVTKKITTNNFTKERTK